MATPTQNPLALFYRSVNPMMVCDDRRRYVAVNDAACNLLRKSREELLSESVDDVTPPENLDGIDEIWNSFLTAGSLVGTYALLTGDGRRVEVEYNATANVLPGRHLTIFVVHPEGHREQVEPAMDTLDPGSVPNLSPREVQVLEQLALGYRGTEIAEQLGISPDTVRVHVRNAMRKLGARTRAQAIGIAMSKGIVTLET
ncbi:MAG: LuxR C-terminal-related transcriptional regulator [Solirubrobacterales bacterium]